MENEIFDPFEEPKDPRREGKKESLALTFWIFLIILFVFLLSYFNRSSSDNFPTENIISSPTSLLNSNVTNTPNSVNATETALPEIIIAPTSLPATEVPLEGLMVFSIMEAGYFHLFAYEPTSQLFTRLSIGEANDVDPRLSPDGTKIAFSSDRKGQSYIYVLNLLTGETLAVTNDIEHDSRPSWSSDGLWLTFERVEKNNVDIFIQPIDSSIPPIKITFDLHSDFSPTWHPDGKTIAFASSRTGNFDIWTINIEDLGNDGYLQQITSTPQDETNPIWSPSGDLLAWSSTHQGFQSIFISNPQIKEDFIQIIGRGNYTRWDPSGKNLITDIRSPQKDLIAIYKLNEQSQLINSFSPPGNIRGMDWGSNALPTNLPENMQTIADQELSTPWTNIENENMENDFGRYELSTLSNIHAPKPQLNQLVEESFISLQKRLANELGWDFLSDLENAFVPLTEKLPPGHSNSWLYTGRAFAFNPDFLKTEWLKVVREDFGKETYWRIFIKPIDQDGSVGNPMTQFNWDFSGINLENSADVSLGGKQKSSIPGGYWVDFTSIASAYGWGRQPALENWIQYYPGNQFNLFAAMNGLSWQESMLQIYPPEIFMSSQSGDTQ